MYMKLSELYENKTFSTEELVALFPKIIAYIGNVHSSGEGQEGKRALESMFNSPAGQSLMYNGPMERVIMSYSGQPEMTFKTATTGPKSKGIHSFFKGDVADSSIEDFLEPFYEGGEDSPETIIRVKQNGKALDLEKIQNLYNSLGNKETLRKMGIEPHHILLYMERSAKTGEVLAPYYSNVHPIEYW